MRDGTRVKAKDNKYIKFWAWVYRRTGFLHSHIKVAEYEYLMGSIGIIQRIYDQDDKYFFEESLEDIVNMVVSSNFQVAIGLHICAKHFIWPTDSKTEAVIKTIRRLLGV